MSTTEQQQVPEGDIAFVTDQIAERADAPAGPSPRERRARMLRPIMWRLHFIGGFLAGPIVISLALTGILYAWNPQIDQVRFGDVLANSGGPATVALADQVAAAQAAHPDWGVFAVTPANGGTNTMVLMDPPGGAPGFSGPADGVEVYVDPATGDVAGEIVQTERSANLLRTLHSSWRLGDDVRPLTELAGSWFMVTLLTGLYLWWPGLRRRGAAAFALRRGVRGRRRSKDMHNFLGLAFLVPMLLLALTGLTWTQFAGERTGTVIGWMSVPRLAADTAVPDPVEGGADLANIDLVNDRAVAEQLVEPYRIVLPTADDVAWTVASQDVTFPVERDQLTVDGTTGELVDRVDYSAEHWMNKLRTAGVLFHQAQLFGLPLQVFMTVLALAIVALVVYGYRMWWQRRPKEGMGAPPPVRDWLRNAPLWLVGITLALGWFMPVLGVSLLAWLVLEAGWRVVGVLSGRVAEPPRAGLARAAAIAALGVAMILTPALGEGRELGALPRAMTWAWSRPLGLAFMVLGLIGVAAMVGRRDDGTDEGSGDQAEVGAAAA